MDAINDKTPTHKRTNKYNKLPNDENPKSFTQL